MRRGLMNVVLAKPLSIASPAGQLQFRLGHILWRISRWEIGRAAFIVILDVLFRIQEYINEAASLKP